MSFYSNVVPPRRVREKPRWPWACECPGTTTTRTDPSFKRQNPGYLARCPDCGSRRP